MRVKGEPRLLSAEKLAPTLLCPTDGDHEAPWFAFQEYTNRECFQVARIDQCTISFSV